ncbi:HEAT repeat domain-containing protein [Brevibacillus borstelensis]|uniref:HEAT repeat domain-containing protein n=1 Tax=Brevibacillus borstelensis TaxID=45462 RepID=UPI0030C48FAF
MFQQLQTAYLFLIVSSVLIAAGIIALLCLKCRHLYVTREKQKSAARLQDYIAYVLSHLDDDQPLESPAFQLAKRDVQVLEEKLIEIAERVKGKHREQLTALFEKLGLPELEISRLKQLPGPLRTDAAYKLGAMGHEKATPALLSMLRAENDEAGRYIIARAIARCTRNISDLREMVEAMIKSSHDSPKLLAEVLGDSRLDLLPLLREWIKSGDSRFTLVALASLPATSLDESLIDSLWQLLDAEEKEVRIQAARLVLSDVKSSSEQIHSLMANEDWEVRALAVKAIGTWQDAAKIPVLLKALDDQNWWVKYHAARSLVKVGAEGFQALCEVASRTTHKETADLAMQQLREVLREERLAGQGLSGSDERDHKLTIYDSYFNRQKERVI